MTAQSVIARGRFFQRSYRAAAGALSAVMVILLVSAPVAGPAAAASCPGNAKALGLSRTVEIDTTGGPGFGFEQYKAHDFLQPKEIVLTFDDGPWPANTPAVLEALAKHCTKATFFAIGKHSIWHPEILKQVAAAGHTIGGHTWSHANLGKLKGERPIEEIEKGFSAIKLALGAAPASFFRFPYLQDPAELVTYLGKRNVAIFSHDVDSFDFKFRKPEQVIKSVLDKLEKKGKGIVLLHDFQGATAKGLPDLLDQLQAKGYRIVHMRAKNAVTTLPDWDAAAAKELKGPVGSGQPTTSVVRTVPSQ